MSATIASSLQRLRSAGLTPPDRTRGCSGEEVAHLESKLGFRLPATYREFLLALGHDAGSFMVGSDFSFDRLLDLQVEARALAREGAPRTAFPFLMHQGYEFLFFMVGDDEDPQVHRFEEGGTGAPLGMTFSAWFAMATEDEIRLSRLSRASVQKDSSIIRLVERLSLGARGWTETDTWDGDLCAVGLARSDDPRRCVYVSTWKRARDRYYYECETPTGPGATDYEVTERGEDVDFEMLLRAMERHLGGEYGTTSAPPAQ